jgi:FkbM family methyltransferase
VNRLVRFVAKAVARLGGSDLLTLAYNDIGVLKYQDSGVSGEEHMIRKVLKTHMTNIPKPVFFDVGANVGKISILLREAFPHAEIWAFEPNKSAYGQLSGAVSGRGVKCVNIGLGSTCTTETLYLPAADASSSHATIHKSMFDEFYAVTDVQAQPFEMRTIDHVCSEHQIGAIDFLKVDTEGNELLVLKGAGRMLSERRVRVILFEFGECHVYSRTFLRDFYELLTGFTFYRLDSSRLIPLGNYNVRHEIFRFQNIVAIRRDDSVR